MSHHRWARRDPTAVWDGGPVGPRATPGENYVWMKNTRCTQCRGKSDEICMMCIKHLRRLSRFIRSRQFRILIFAPHITHIQKSNASTWSGPYGRNMLCRENENKYWVQIVGICLRERSGKRKWSQWLLKISDDFSAQSLPTGPQCTMGLSIALRISKITKSSGPDFGQFWSKSSEAVWDRRKAAQRFRENISVRYLSKMWYL